MEKQKEAKERQLERNKRSPKDQLSRLDSIFGKGLGAKKEREKINVILNKKIEKNSESETKAEIKEKKSKKKKLKNVSDE
jgi:hypothetical protein